MYSEINKTKDSVCVCVFERVTEIQRDRERGRDACDAHHFIMVYIILSQCCIKNDYTSQY